MDAFTTLHIINNLQPALTMAELSFERIYTIPYPFSAIARNIWNTSCGYPAVAQPNRVDLSITRFRFWLGVLYALLTLLYFCKRPFFQIELRSIACNL